MLWGSVLGLALLWLFLVAPNARARKRGAARLGDWAYAHRGLHGKEIPENSLPAFRLAAEKGYGIEMDVRLTRDGEMAVLHDESLLRMCGVDRNIGDATLDELRACRLLGTAWTVPTLDEALEAVKGRVPLIIELKSDPSVVKKLPPLLYERMRTYSGAWCVESFDPRMLRWFRKHAPHVLRGQLAFDPYRLKHDPHRGFRYILAARLLMNWLSRPDFVAYAYETAGNASFRVMRALFHPVMAAWTVRSKEDFEKLDDAIRIFEGFEP